MVLLKMPDTIVHLHHDHTILAVYVVQGFFWTERNGNFIEC